MTKFLSISSGSNGNCYYLGNEKTALVIDMGIGGRTLKKRLAENGLAMESIEMILVTHDHIDHIKYLGSVAQKLSVPVFTTSKLNVSLENHPCTRGYLSGCRRIIKKETFFEHRGVKFASFSVPHDATDTVGYFIDFFGDKFVFMTDLGSVPDYAIEYCRLADHIIIESNYDMDMLIHGSYSPELKHRIMEGHGHLSNYQCATALKSIYNENLKSIFLCHLSENNNTPEKAYKASCDALSSINVRIGEDIKLYCLPRRESSPLFCLGND